MIYFNLDKNIKKPMYLQISDQIRKMILNNELKYNQKLFSEKEFTYIYNVSEIVVKQAYSILRKEGLIRSVKGLGTFVTNREVITLDFNDLFYISGFNDETFKTIILTNEKVELNENLISTFKVDEDEIIYRLNLIITKNTLPYIYRTIYYKEKYKSNLDDYFNNSTNILQYFNNQKNMKLKTALVYNTKVADPIIASILLINEKDPVASYKVTLANDKEIFMHIETEIPGNYLITRKETNYHK